MEIAIVWLVLVICTGVVASNKGRSVIGWVLIAVLIAPITILILLALPPLQQERRSMEPYGYMSSPAPSRSAPADTKICPRCAETIKKAALVCRYCGAEFAPAVDLSVGANVHHALHGDGRITQVGDDGTVLVQFTKIESRVLARDLSPRGKPLDPTQTCPNCYALSAADASNCGRCGHEFRHHART